MSRLVATLAGIGYLRPAPGTWGSLVALPLAWAVHVLGGFWLFAAATVAVTVVGWWAVARETAGRADKDPSEIVIDEVAGQWIALWPVSYGAVFAGVGFLDLWPGIVTAFLAFRVFDIWKPGPVGWADRQEGAMGVMADDLIAGWMAALVVAVAAVVAHVPMILGS
ncbi:phosphatidylglycerophosphatase A [Roseibacterium sp. SDUM158016]|uniref:phosphatidylglycerophosphatase A family protein n=1 Tax=Roseicyclus sediminis TaxID=2980997 RepID=UPI0021CF1CA5|nr:phosphatidylglycerophosphatase A [Roseibacterium sp. SDUM158016]MCU4651863.1 phosphatidylglycerophosphatase A [Roseibacterium sp. SDUM158016]